MAAAQSGEFYESKLEEFQKRTVNKETFQGFIDDVENIISEINSSIDELRQDIDRLQRKKDDLVNDQGDEALEQLRQRSTGTGVHYDIKEIREIVEEIEEKRRKMFERAMVRADMELVIRKKITPILESLDAQDIERQAFDRMDELTRQRIDNLEERIETRLSEVDRKHDQKYDDLNRQVRDVREASRRELSDQQEAVFELMEKVIEFAEGGRPLSQDDLNDAAEKVKGGDEVDSVDLTPPEGEFGVGQESGVSDSEQTEDAGSSFNDSSDSESSSVPPGSSKSESSGSKEKGAGDDGGDSYDWPDFPASKTKQAVLEEVLKKKFDSSNGFNPSYREMARQYETSKSYIADIKSKLEDRDVI